ncbi:hypothetical protein J4E90_001217 [Alternaria incomplexa]|uniref:uncharacterized protein n=1 Tax=Alternaria incomplexa TaxID=1187928 RepID=UPI00221F342F|nr:uncharacterized protein J4E90_001217 [Alternaria incomplexa]KAI4922783.1 hypothetical protein J4E90_001217 [Alternaria incomplexa]
MGWRDEWPVGSNGEEYDGKQILTLVRDNASPFRDVWNVQLLIDEIEEKLQVEVTDIPTIDKGSNNYGFHLQVRDGPDLVVRLARGDVNMPDFDGFVVERQIAEVEFEAATYDLLRNEAGVRASRLIYHRAPVLKPGPNVQIPADLSGRRIFVFERSDGTNNVWKGLDAEAKTVLLDQLARMRAALFNYCPPSGFAVKYLHSRIFDSKPDAFRLPVAPTREFWIHLIQSKIEATIKNEGDMIGWEDDEETVGPVALAAKQSLLKAIPHLLPQESSDILYRLVLEHGDFGIHNTSVITDNNRKPQVTSLYDWETACIVPALLADPLVAAGPVDLITNERAEPAVTRIPGSPTAAELEAYATWSRHYIKVCLYRTLLTIVVR